MLLAEGSTLTTGEGGLVGVVVLAILGLVGIVIQARRQGRDSTSQERTELLKQYRDERDAANTRAAAAETENDRLRVELLTAQGKAQLAEIAKQGALNTVASLTAEIARLRKTVEKKIPEPTEESDHGTAADIA